MLLMSAPIASRIAASVALASDASSASSTRARAFESLNLSPGCWQRLLVLLIRGEQSGPRPSERLILIKRRRRLEPAKACLDVYR